MATITLDRQESKTFNELMQATYRKVFNLAFRLAGNRTDAEDLTQEAFFRAYRGFREYEGDRPFENWIFRILTRLFLDLVRSRKRRLQPVSFDAPHRLDGGDDTVRFEIADRTAGPEDLLMQQHISAELEAALNKLKPEQRVLVMMADVEDMPYQEIADLMKVPVGTVRSRLHRAHKQLRTILERQTKANSGQIGWFPNQLAT